MSYTKTEIQFQVLTIYMQLDVNDMSENLELFHWIPAPEVCCLHVVFFQLITAFKMIGDIQF